MSLPRSSYAASETSNPSHLLSTEQNNQRGLTRRQNIITAQRYIDDDAATQAIPVASKFADAHDRRPFLSKYDAIFPSLAAFVSECLINPFFDRRLHIRFQ